ncbi:MAG: hypothetical protein KDJ97_37165 [Anaerolineae bacterium]|nr:hypothetical protein [Anaerolineae bacterium]
MDTATYIPRQKIGVTLPKVLVQQAKKKAARELGFTLPELVRHFIANYLTDQKTILKNEWLLPKAEQRLTKEVDHFYKHEFKNSKGYTSTQELMQALEE